MKAYHNLCTR